MPCANAGSALVMTLPVLGILLLLIVAALFIVTSEMQQAASVLERQRAEVVGRIAVDEVAAKLAQIPIDKHWAAAPGLIRYWNGSNWNNTIPLHSGYTAEGFNDPDQQVNLNQRLADGGWFILPSNDEYATAPQMHVNWRYILDDGSIVSAPLGGDQNPVGRFAYWVDLENARVNINTAGFGMTEADYHLANTPFDTIIKNYDTLVHATNPWMTDRVTFTLDGPQFSNIDRDAIQEARRRTPQNLMAHPSSVDLAHLEDISEVESFNTFRYAGAYFLRIDAHNSAWKLAPSSAHEINRYSPPAPGTDLAIRFFNTPEDWKMIVGKDKYAKNKGYITTRGRTPEINPWGLPKMALSEMGSNGNPINDLSLDSWRRYAKANFVATEDLVQDTRMVEVPPLMGFTNTDPRRDTFRDLTTVYYSSGQQPAWRGLLGALEGLLDTPAPGFTETLWQKYEDTSDQNDPASSGGVQFSLDLMSYVDGSLNWNVPGFQAFSPRGFVGNRRIGGYTLDSPTGDPNRKLFRIGTPGQFLINELVLQAEPVHYLDTTNPPVLKAGTLPANPTPEQIEDYINEVNEKVKALAPARNMPRARLVNHGHEYADVFLYMIRDLKPDDYYIRVNLTPEVIRAAYYGPDNLTPKGTASRGMEVRFSVRTNSVSWVSDDPDTASGSMNMNLGSNVFTTNRPEWKQVEFGMLRWDTAEVWSAGTYAVPTVPRHARFLIGPFAAGSVVSSLRVRLHFAANYGGELSHRSRVMSYPGTIDALDSTGSASPNIGEDETAYYQDVNDKLLEFEFTDIDTLSPITQFASKELIDPRLGRKKEHWVSRDADDHSLGGENESYTQSIAGGGDPSDLARPPALLQEIRGRGRRLSYGNAYAAGAERQNASLILGLPGVGYLSSVPTGVESNTPWQTLRFDNTATQTANTPPDWLLWNLMYVPFDRSMANQTDGKLNLNATLHPFGITRTRPLQALLGNRVADAATRATLARAIANGPPALPGLPTDLYVYSGQLCTVPGVADTGNEYEREALPRDLADIVTTQCDDYRVFVIAESVRRLPNGRIVTMATQRSEVTLSRSPDGGPTGYYFTELDSVSNKAFPFYRRDAYDANGHSAPQRNAFHQADRDNHKSPLGADRRPNTADDWLLLQRLDISSYRHVY